MQIDSILDTTQNNNLSEENSLDYIQDSYKILQRPNFNSTLNNLNIALPVFEINTVIDSSQDNEIQLENGNKLCGLFTSFCGKSGCGTIYYSEGSKFLGSWSEFMANDYGKLIYPDGAFYQGNLKNDLLQGQGILIKEDQTIFSGNWIQNKKEGHFTVKYLNGN